MALFNAMSQRNESRLRPAFDRPLRRLAWVAPASLCAWILVLIGFSFLLGKIDQQPPVQPLEVSLADLSAGIPGGSPGGHPGPAGDGGAGGNAADRSLLPAPHALAPRPLNHAPLVTEPPIPTAAPRQRRRPARPAMKRKVEAAAALAVLRTRPDTRAQLEDDNAPEPAFLKPRAVAAPAAPPSAPSAKLATAPPDAAGSPGSAAAASAGGGGNGNGSGATAGSGSGGAGGGTGGGFGAGSQLYAAVEHPPVPISRVLPEYPSTARARGLEGEVVLRAIVDRQGAVEQQVVVVESVPLLDQAAIEALRRWRFEPGRDANNRPVRVVIQVPLRFRLR